MKLLFTAYYFPPMGLSGVGRTLKFVKYLSRLGWDIEVLTTSPGRYYAFDDSLMEEVPERVRVTRTASLDPFHLNLASGRQRSTMLPTAGGRSFSRFVFVPDSKIGWYPFAVSKGNASVRAGKPDIVLATAPPWTSFLVGRTIAKRAGVPLVLDYRDSWLMDPQSPEPTAFHRRVAARLEAGVVRSASAIVAVNDTVNEELRIRYPEKKAAFSTIYNGFDPEDLETLPGIESPFTRQAGEALRIFYMGTLYQDVNRPLRFFDALELLRKEHGRDAPPVEAVFMGVTDDRYRGIVRKKGIEQMVTFIPYRQHRQALACLEQADAALLLVDPEPHADRHVPGKLFEYLGARVPVIALAPGNSEAVRIIEENRAGEATDPEDPEAIAGLLKDWITRKSTGESLPSISPDLLDPFNRQEQAGALDALLRSQLSSR